jgi:hypothetical protein
MHDNDEIDGDIRLTLALTVIIAIASVIFIFWVQNP